MSKKFLYVLIFSVLLFDNNTFGQKARFNDDLPQYNTGIELGPNLTSYVSFHKYETNTTNLFRFGFTCGPFFQYNISSHFSLRTNISYSRIIYADRLCLLTIANEYNYIECRTINNYINLPLLIKLNIDNNRFYFIAGPNLDFAINHKCRIISDYYDSITNKQNCKGEPHLKLAFGLGTNIPISKKYFLSFEIKDNFGSFGFHKKDSRLTINGNSVFFLYSLTYQFGKLKK
jgi:hypothetical protein